MSESKYQKMLYKRLHAQKIRVEIFEALITARIYEEREAVIKAVPNLKRMISGWESEKEKLGNIVKKILGKKAYNEIFRRNSNVTNSKSQRAQEKGRELQPSKNKRVKSPRTTSVGSRKTSRRS